MYRFDKGAWTLVKAEEYAYAVAVHPQRNCVLALATNDHPFHDKSSATGVWLSTDCGANWSKQNNQLPMLRVSAIAFNPYSPNQLIIGTYGRGFFTTTVQDTALSHQVHLPTVFR